MSRIEKKLCIVLVAIFFVFLTSTVHPAYAALPSFDLGTKIESFLGKFQDSSSVPSDCTAPATPLALGSYGPEVKKLQVWLGQNGYPVVAAGKESQYFGPLTHFALIKFQSVAGIRPVSGFYGPITKAEITKRCAAFAQESKIIKVTIAPGSPKGATLVRGSVNVELLRLDLTGKSVLDSLTVHRYGAGNKSRFSKIYLFDGDTRLTTGYSFDKESWKVTFTNLNLPVNGVKTLRIVGNITRTEQPESDGIEILSGGIVASDGASGNFPLRSGSFTGGAEEINEVSIEQIAFSPELLIGQREAKVADFRISPEGNEGVLMHSIALVVDGTINPAQISNFVLKHGETVMAMASAVNARGQILLRFDEPLLVKSSDRLRFELFADLGASIEDGQTLGIYMDDSIDLKVVGVRSASGVPVDISDYNNTSGSVADASWVTVRGGTVTYVYRGPSIANYAAGQNDVELMRFDMKAKSTIETREMRFMLTAGGAHASGTLSTTGGLCNLTQANYTDIKLVDATSGAVLTRPLQAICETGEQDNSQMLVFEDRWMVPAGQTRSVKLVADIGQFAPASNETIKATFLAFEREDIRNLDSGSYLGSRDVVPAGNMTGATHNVYASAAAASLAETVALIGSELSTN